MSVPLGYRSVQLQVSASASASSATNSSQPTAFASDRVLTFIAYVSKLLLRSRENATAAQNTLFLRLDDFGRQRNLAGQGAQSKVLVAGGQVNGEPVATISRYALKVTLPPREEDEEVNYAALRKSRFQNALAEIIILTCPPLASHQSIVKFLGILWENDEEVGPDQSVYPSIVIEEADLGSLSEYLLKTIYPEENNLAYEIKRSLGLCVALGLDALHACGIIHGDVKPENVLVFADPDMPGGIRAKLTDFGHSAFLHRDNDSEQWYKASPGTPRWNAPEVRPNLDKLNIAKEQDIYLTAEGMILTDVYSFGLLYWNILLNGADGFNYIPDIQAAFAAKDFVRRDQLVRQNMDKNLMMYWSCRSTELFGTWPGTQNDEVLKDEVKIVFEWTLDTLPERRKKNLGKLFISIPSTSALRRQEMLKNFNRSVVEHALSDLPPSKIEDIDTYPNMVDLLDHRNWFDRQNIGVRNLVSSCFQSEARSVAHDDDRRPVLCYNLALCYLYGFGNEIDRDEAKTFLDEAASLGNQAAERIRDRVFRPDEGDETDNANNERNPEDGKDMTNSLDAVETNLNSLHIDENHQNSYHETVNEAKPTEDISRERDAEGSNDILWWIPADPWVKDHLGEIVPQDGIELSRHDTSGQSESPFMCPVTFLDLAVESGDLESVKQLLSHGATVKFRMIYQAAIHYESEILAALLAALHFRERDNRRISERVLLEQVARAGDGAVQSILRHGNSSGYEFEKTMEIIEGLNQNPYQDISPTTGHSTRDDSTSQGLERFRMALFSACESGDYGLVEYILQRPYVGDILTSSSDPSVQEFKYFLLLDVIARGDMESYLILVDYGIDPTSTTGDFMIRVLSFCTSRPGRLAFLEDLLSRGPWPVLDDRVEYDDENQEDYLTHADKSLEDDADGDFFSAVLYRNWEVATFLLTQSTDPARCQRSALMRMMVTKSFLSMPQLKYLLNEKPNPIHPGHPIPAVEFIIHRKRGVSILHWLCMGGYKMDQFSPEINDVDMREIARYVRGKYRGPQLETPAIMLPLTPLMTATQFGNKHVAEVLLTSVDAGTTIQHDLGQVNALDLGLMICKILPQDTYDFFKYGPKKISEDLWKKTYLEYRKDVEAICVMLYKNHARPVLVQFPLPNLQVPAVQEAIEKLRNGARGIVPDLDEQILLAHIEQ